MSSADDIMAELQRLQNKTAPSCRIAAEIGTLIRTQEGYSLPTISSVMTEWGLKTEKPVIKAFNILLNNPALRLLKMDGDRYAIAPRR